MSLFLNSQLELALRKIADCGFNQIEFSCYEGPHLEALERNLPGVQALLLELGFSVPAAHTICLGVDPGSPDEQERREAVRRITSVFKPLAQIGTEYVVHHPTADLHNHYTNEMRDQVWSQAVRSIHEISELADSAGLKLAVENLQLRGRPRPGCSAVELLEMIEGAGDHVGICLDTGHAAMNGFDAVAELEVAAEKLFYLHLHDNDGTTDYHWLPGRGVIDWDAFLATLNRLGFSGPRTLEIKAAHDEQDQLLHDATVLVDRWTEPVSRA